MMVDRIICGDALEELPAIPEDSIDAIVTDPPAGIAFMNKEWDRDKGGRDKWISWMEEIAFGCLRVIKPGGHALVWALPRTSHWTGMAWENAGWEPRDKIAHVFGSGFPKSLDISKAIDKMAGAKGEIIGKDQYADRGAGINGSTFKYDKSEASERGNITAPSTTAAKQWAGFGTALKPAHEDWWLFRKPLSETTIAGNVLKWGCGGLNIDGCRIAADSRPLRVNLGQDSPENKGFDGKYGSKAIGTTSAGRFPANLIWSHSPNCKRIGTKKVKGNAHYSYKNSNDGIYELGLGQLDDLGNPLADSDGMETVESWDCHPSCPSWQFAKAGVTKSGAMKKEVPAYEGESTTGFLRGRSGPSNQHGDSGSVSRFFKSCQFAEEDIPAFLYYAKASRSEREKGLDGMPKKFLATMGDGIGKREHNENEPAAWTHNNHPTVKPLELMKYLCRLICPPNGTILDPFGGSGTTGVAAKQEGFHYLIIEKEPEYCEIARRRIAAVPARLDRWFTP